ncbi:hypothetical protein J4410_02200 [Candidatus Woesearchaeota archaeon]|nr:hypothetical protein [Candidatus Woesearchaeota archaeon]
MSNPIFTVLYRKIRAHYAAHPEAVRFIGITGEYAAGKTWFSEAFARYLREQKIDAHPLETDMYFLFSKAERFALEARLREEGQLEERRHEGYTLDTDRWLTHLRQLRERTPVSDRGLYQRKTGEKDLVLEVSFNGQEKWVLFDGVWVSGQPIRQYMDVMVQLLAEEGVRRERARLRAASLNIPYEQTPERFRGIDELTRRCLCRDPEDIVINNSNFDNPVLVKK